MIETFAQKEIRDYPEPNLSELDPKTFTEFTLNDMLLWKRLLEFLVIYTYTHHMKVIHKNSFKISWWKTELQITAKIGQSLQFQKSCSFSFRVGRN